MTVKQTANTTVLKAFIHGHSELPLHNLVVKTRVQSYVVIHNGVESQMMGYHTAISRVENIILEDNRIVGELLGWSD